MSKSVITFYYALTFSVFVFVALAAFACTAGAADVPLVKSSNEWKFGDPIPAELLVLREFQESWSTPTDTVPVFESITNYVLLQNVVFLPCDERIFACAVERALLLVGPNRFFGDARQRYSLRPGLLSQTRHQALNARSKLPHVVVD